MSFAVDKDLTVPAARLALAAPREWKEFLAAFQKFAEARRDQLVQASLDELQRTQGRAQQCNLLVALLNDAIEAANRVTAPAANKPKA